MKRFEDFEKDDKSNWLTVNLTYFKPTGKYYSDIDHVQVPNDCSFYVRREYLYEYIDRLAGSESFTYVSLDSHVLGFPFMKVASKSQV